MVKFLFHISVILSALLVLLTGCGDSFDALEAEARIQTFDLNGIEVHYRVAYAAPPDTFSIDTVEISSYRIELEIPADKPDTLHFYGLPGAKKAYFSHGVNGNYRRCQIPSSPYCDLYARLYDDKPFEMYLVSPGGMYTADGKLENGTLELEGNYFYRGTSIDYFLTGQRVK